MMGSPDVCDTQAILQAINDLISAEAHAETLSDIRQTGVNTFENFMVFCGAIKTIDAIFASEPARRDGSFRFASEDRTFKCSLGAMSR